MGSIPLSLRSTKQIKTGLAPVFLLHINKEGTAPARDIWEQMYSMAVFVNSMFTILKKACFKGFMGDKRGQFLRIYEKNVINTVQK